MAKSYEFNEEIAKEICHEISSTSKGLRQLCKLNKHWPSRAHIFRWLHLYPSFRDLYARAKINQIESLVDDIIEISDDSSNDHSTDENGKTVVNYDNIQRARLRIDTRKWLASKLVPRVYGDNKENKENNEDAISKFRVTS